MRKVLPYLSITLSLLVWSCHDTGPVFSGCCSEPGHFLDVGVGKIGIPNIFTPNGDGINDQLWVFGDSIRQINYLRITNRNEEVVFEVHNVPTDDNASAWDGKINGQVEKGIYTIEFEAEGIDGYIFNYSGQVCNFICDESDDHESLDPWNCLFGHQIYDFLYTHGQVEYQEHLPCLN